MSKSKTVTGQGTLKIGGQAMPVSFTVPAGRCGPDVLLPDLRQLAGQVIDHAAAATEKEGRRVSCAKGCASCCRQLIPISPVDTEAFRFYSLAYFRTGVPCPFLEDESCSIYPDRPLVCREYVVTSPPALCATLGEGKVQRVLVQLSLWIILSRAASDDGRLEWMPLIDALDYAASRPRPAPRRQGPQYVEAVLKLLKS
jgi:hypothetical protein